MKGVEHIDEVHAFVIRDVDGTEGVPAIAGPNGPIYLMTAGATATGAVVGKMRGWAVEVAKHLRPGQTMTHVVFRERTDLEQL